MNTIQENEIIMNTLQEVEINKIISDKKETLEEHEVISFKHRERLAYYFDNINDCSENEQFQDLTSDNTDAVKEEYYSSAFDYIQKNKDLRTIVVDMIHDRTQKSSFYKFEERLVAEIKSYEEKKVSA